MAAVLRKLVVALAAFSLLGVLFSPVSGAQTDPIDCDVDIGDYTGAQISVVPINAEAGDTLTITGQGFPPGSSIPLQFNGVVIATPVADAAGDFEITFQIPLNTPSGQVTFSAVCGSFALSANITIAPTPVTTVATTVPVVGSNSLGLVQVGGVLLAVGGLLILVAARNRKQESLIHS